MKRTMLVAMAIFLLISATLAAQEQTPEKKADIEKLLEVTGALNIGAQFGGTMLKQFEEAIRAVRPDIPDSFFSALQEEVIKLLEEKMRGEGGFLDLIVPIYNEYYTHDEIKQLLAFYETDVGKKTIRILPMLTQASLEAGQEWGASLGPLIQQTLEAKLKEEGLEPPR